jgi:alcohol dehydrogenase class IV
MQRPRATAELRRFVVPELVLGAGARRRVGSCAANLGARRVLLVTDPGVERAGWAGDVEAALRARGLSTTVYTRVHENPRASEVMEGLAAYRRGDCDVIVCVGGGSPIDCAKGIGVVATSGGDILDYEGVDAVESALPPLVCVPTTGGSGADVSQFAIITAEDACRKIAIVSKAIVPDVSLLDPEVLVTLPPEVTARTGVDALAHAIEAYVSNASSDLSDLYALEALRIIASSLVASRASPLDLGLRARMMQASLLAGVAFSNASLGAVHAMAHALGGLTDAPYGLCNAAVIAPVVAWNHAVAPERFEAIARALGLVVAPADVVPAITGWLRRLFAALGLAPSVRGCGASARDVPRLVDAALRDPSMATNPRCAAPADVERLFHEAL